jgi:hypothetical protein
MKAGFLILIFLATGLIIGSITLYSENKKGLSIFGGLLALASLAGSLLIYFREESKIRCNPNKWLSRKNVILPYNIGEPYSSNVTSLCEAQKIAEYKENADAFYYTNSIMWIVKEDGPVVEYTTNSNTIYTFYYMKSDYVKPYFNTQECKRIDVPNNAYELFINRAGTGLYIGDFTIQNPDGTTALVYDSSMLQAPPGQVPLSTKNVPNFSWSACTPEFAKKLVPKMLKDIRPEQEKIIKIDTWIMKSFVDHLMIVETDSSAHDKFWTVTEGPWKKTMEIKGKNMFHKDAIVKYNNNSYIGTSAITETLRNLLIRE